MNSTKAKPAVLGAVRRTEVRLLLSAAGVMAGIWGFMALTGEVQEQETARLDRSLLMMFRHAGDLGTPIGPKWLQESCRDITAMGGFTELAIISIIALAILLIHGRRMQAAIFAGTFLLAQAAAEVIKHFVGRARPEIVPHHDLVYSSSFPSGHSVMAPVVYLTLATIIAANDSSRPVKIVLLCSAAILVVAIGISRVYLGVHWPTDVLAGWTLGTIIALAASMALHLTGRIRDERDAAPSLSPEPER